MYLLLSSKVFEEIKNHFLWQTLMSFNLYYKNTLSEQDDGILENTDM